MFLCHDFFVAEILDTGVVTFDGGNDVGISCGSGSGGGGGGGSGGGRSASSSTLLCSARKYIILRNYFNLFYTSMAL